MKPYVTRHLGQSIQDIRTNVRKIAEYRVQQKANMPSSVLGSVDNPEAVTDSYIYGKVITHGSARMHQCVVNKGVTVELEDGAIVIGCTFEAKSLGHLNVFSSDSSPDISFIDCSVKIGKNSTLMYTEFFGGLVVDDGMCAYASKLGMSDETPFIKNQYGKNVTICKSSIDAGRYDYQMSKDGELIVGDNFFMYNSRVFFIGGEKAHIGNDVVICEYKDALKLITSVTTTTMALLGNSLTEHNPMITNYEYHHGPKSHTISYFGTTEHDIYIGNDVYIGSGYDFLVVPKSENASISIGDGSILCSIVPNEGNSSYGSQQDSCFNFQVVDIKIGANSRVLYSNSRQYYGRGRSIMHKLEVGDESVVILTLDTSNSGCQSEQLLKPRTIAYI